MSQRPPVSTVRAVERALEILTVFSPERPELALAQISAAVGLPKSSIYRLLSTMERLGFIARNHQNQHYRPGPHLMHFGTRMAQQPDLAGLARPVMENLRDRCGEGVTLHLRQELEHVIVAKVEGTFKLRQFVEVGERAPLALGASGKAILAWLPAEEWPEEHRAELARIRRQGYVITTGERIPGAFGCSAPIFDLRGEIIACLSISGAAIRLTPDRRPVLAGLVREGAAAISREMGATRQQPTATAVAQPTRRTTQMDFRLSPELEMLRQGVATFRERYLDPLEKQFLIDGHLTTEQRITLELQGRENGYWALEVPEADGGAGLGQLAMCVVVEELFKSPTMFEFGGSPEPALSRCTPEQKQRWYFPIIEGKKRCCYAFTEPDTGSDLARIRTTATRKGDNWVLNGTKTFISYVDKADFVILFASTDPAKGAKGVTAFLVDKGTPGFTIPRQIPTMGDDWDPHELVFDQCEIPDDQRLGEVDGGWEIANYQLTHGRLKIAAFQLGIAQRSLDIAVDWAKQRVTFGKLLGARQSIQWMLADSEVELQAARLLTWQAAWLHDEGQVGRSEAMAAKLYSTEMAQRVTDRCLQILGGLGYTRELPIQSFYRQVRVWRIGHGASEIMRWMIARNMLGAAARD